MRPCSTPGCRSLVKRGRCDRCEGGREPARDDRESAAKRGYDRTWERFRHWFMTRHPLCQDCQERGEIVPAEEVHHIAKLASNPELRCVEENCRALCKACHSRRTARGE